MPWTVFLELEQARKRARGAAERAQGLCVEDLLAQTSALLRRRGSDDMATILSLLTGAAYCVPCISVITHLDARRIYAALERLKASANVRLLLARCNRCGRTTTVHTIAE